MPGVTDEDIKLLEKAIIQSTELQRADGLWKGQVEPRGTIIKVVDSLIQLATSEDKTNSEALETMLKARSELTDLVVVLHSSTISTDPDMPAIGANAMPLVMTLSELNGRVGKHITELARDPEARDELVEELGRSMHEMPEVAEAYAEDLPIEVNNALGRLTQAIEARNSEEGFGPFENIAAAASDAARISSAWLKANTAEMGSETSNASEAYQGCALVTSKCFQVATNVKDYIANVNEQSEEKVGPQVGPSRCAP